MKEGVLCYVSKMFKLPKALVLLRVPSPLDFF